MLIFALISIIILVGIDQILKLLVIKYIELGESISVIKFGKHEIFNLNYVLNDGAGWSILSGKTIFLVIFTSIFIIAAIIYLIKFAKRHLILVSSLALIIAGGIGNLIDRIFRDGSVIDYIETRFINFPIFNFADICVTIGAILLIIYVIFFDKENKSTDKKIDELDISNE